jgi:hypothetical protein
VVIDISIMLKELKGLILVEEVEGVEGVEGVEVG